MTEKYCDGCVGGCSVADDLTWSESESEDEIDEGLLPIKTRGASIIKDNNEEISSVELSKSPVLPSKAAQPKRKDHRESWLMSLLKTSVKYLLLLLVSIAILGVLTSISDSIALDRKRKFVAKEVLADPFCDPRRRYYFESNGYRDCKRAENRVTQSTLSAVVQMFFDSISKRLRNVAWGSALACSLMFLPTIIKRFVGWPF